MSAALFELVEKSAENSVDAWKDLVFPCVPIPRKVKNKRRRYACLKT